MSKKKKNKLPLKISGYQVGDEDCRFFDLEEICIHTDPKSLKKLGKFLIEISKTIDDYDHHHLNNHGNGTEVVILSPKFMKEHEEEVKRIKAAREEQDETVQHP